MLNKRKWEIKVKQRQVCVSSGRPRRESLVAAKFKKEKREAVKCSTACGYRQGRYSNRFIDITFTFITENYFSWVYFHAPHGSYLKVYLCDVYLNDLFFF